MTTIKEYTIVMDSDPKKLAEKVNQHITQGWQPIGGVCVATQYTLGDNTRTISCQSMVK
jgi:Domain of unknown function (DUF1737)